MDEILDEKTFETRVLKYATASQRTIAWCIDIVLFALISFSVYQFIPLTANFLVFVLKFWYYHVAVIMLYFIFLDGNESQATIGKKLMNIRMLNEHKQDINMKDSTLRFVLSVVLFFGFIQIFSSEKKQTLADKISGTLVVMVK